MVVWGNFLLHTLARRCCSHTGSSDSAKTREKAQVIQCLQAMSQGSHSPPYEMNGPLQLATLFQKDVKSKKCFFQRCADVNLTTQNRQGFLE